MARAVVSLIVRPLLFAAWAFVLWGSFLALAWLASLLSDGPRVTLERITPGAADPVAGWGNILSVALALIVWTLLAVLARRRRAARAARASEPSP